MYHAAAGFIDISRDVVISLHVCLCLHTKDDKLLALVALGKCVFSLCHIYARSLILRYINIIAHTCFVANICTVVWRVSQES